MSNPNTMPKEKTMTNQTPLPLRSDTILGVCEAIGQDFGFNPLYLRLALIAPIFVAPAASVAAYLGLGVIVAAVRYFVPNKLAAEQLVDAKTTVAEEELAIAA
jgi:phage shock protein C